MFTYKKLMTFFSTEYLPAITTFDFFNIMINLFKALTHLRQSIANRDAENMNVRSPVLEKHLKYTNPANTQPPGYLAGLLVGSSAPISHTGPACAGVKHSRESEQ